jgi:hypothetical protein
MTTPAYGPRPTEHSPAIEEQSELTLDANDRIRDVVTGQFGGETPDAIISLSGGIRPSTSSLSESGFTTLSYANANETGVVVPSKTRVMATAAIAQAIPNIPIVTNSVDRTQPTWPTMASVAADELVHRGVDPSRIIKEEASFNTATQLIEMIKLAVDNNWQRLAVIGNDWYGPRLGEFYGRLRSVVRYEDRAQNEAFHAALDRFEEMGGQVGLVSSEEIICLAQPRFRAFMGLAEAALSKTVASEQRGLEDLRAGKYALSLRIGT